MRIRMLLMANLKVCASLLMYIVAQSAVRASTDSSVTTGTTTSPSPNTEKIQNDALLSGHIQKQVYDGKAGSNQGPPKNVQKVIFTDEAEQYRIAEGSASQRLNSHTKSDLRFINDKLLVFGGKVYPIIHGKVNVFGADFVVCGLGIGLDSDFICCNGTFYSKHTGPIQCCGSHFYYTDNEFCCGNVSFPKFTGNQQLGCCKNSFYIVGSQYCCNDQVQTRQCNSCTLSLFDRLLFPGSRQCYNDQAGSSSCNANPSTEFCCGNTVVQKRSYVGCCSGTVYNKDEKICCGKRVFQKRNFCCRKLGPMQILSRFC